MYVLIAYPVRRRLILVCSIADGEHFGRVIRVVFARLHCPFLKKYFVDKCFEPCRSLNPHQSFCLYPLIYHISSYIYIFVSTHYDLVYLIGYNLLPSIFVFYCCCDKLPQTWYLKTTQIRHLNSSVSWKSYKV